MEECIDDSGFQSYPDILDFVPGELWALNLGVPYAWEAPMSNTNRISGASLGGSPTATGTPDPKAASETWRRTMCGQSTNSWEQSSSPEETEIDPRRLKRQVQNRIA